MISYLILIYAVASIATSYAFSYCDMSCSYPNQAPIQHIGCGHNKQFAPSCQATAKIVPIDLSLERYVVHLHNEIRNDIAGGGDPKFPPACRMGTMHYSKDLAATAEFNVLQCISQHDFCHSTSQYKYSGQNLYMYAQCPPKGYNSTHEFELAVKSWAEEIVYTQPNFIGKLPVYNGGNDWRHFTVMIKEVNIAVGCAAAIFISSVSHVVGLKCNNPTDKFEIYLIACNYATTNIYGLPLYTTCANSGEKCKSRNRAPYGNLCAENEEYDVNNISL